MENISALVTGGAGFIGSSIVNKLLKKGWEISIVDNFSTSSNKSIIRNRSYLKEATELIEFDISNPKIKDVLSGKRFDYIFNFGSYSSDRSYEKDPIDGTNKTINGMLNIVQIAKQCNASKIIYPSSGTVYGNTPAPQIETQTLQPQTLYAITKIYLELLSKINKDVSMVGLRIFTGFGAMEVLKGNLSSVVTKFTLSVLNNAPVELYGDGEQKRDFIEVEDIAEIAYRSALNNNIPEIVNVGTGSSYSFNALIDLIAKHAGTEPIVKHVESKTRFVLETRADISIISGLLDYTPAVLPVAYSKYFKELKQLDYNSLIS